MWAIATDEGWVRSYEEFGRLTPGMFDELMKRRQVRHRHSCLYAGLVASTVANFAGKSLKPGTHLTALDFVPMPGNKRHRLAALGLEIKNLVAQIAGTTGGQANLHKVLNRFASSQIQDGLTKEDIENLILEMFPTWKRDAN